MCKLLLWTIIQGQRSILIWGLPVHLITPKHQALSLHKQRCLDMDPYINQYFINSRIPYKLGRVITRWNWETVWECAPHPPFFPGSATRENWASFPTWCQASPPFQCGWRWMSFTASILLNISSHSPPGSVINSHF